MTGLVYKDLINLGQQWKAYLLVLIFWGGMSVMQKNPYFFGGMFSVYVVIVLLTAYSYDEKAGWDKYAMTMPVSITGIVLSKYVLALLMMIVGFVLEVVPFMAAGTPMREVLVSESIFQTVSLFILSFQIPMVFRFGVEKTRYTLAVVCLLPVLIAYVGVNAGIQLPDLDFERLLQLLAYLGPAAGLCLLAVSAAVSVQIYKRKEF